jgi:Lrp/AsnC family transcriptional regulator for asnA, asnC and gidA
LAYRFLSISTQPDKTEYVFQRLYEIPKVFEVYRLGLRPSLSAVVTLKTVEELAQVKQSITKLPFVLGASIEVWTGVRNIPENLLILPLQEAAIKTANTSVKTKSDQVRRPIKIDKINVQIIEKLATDGRMPFRKIAEELEISTDTVVRRYEKLKRNGDLKVIIQINPTKIGYYAFAIFNVACTSQDGLPNRVEALAKIPDVNFILKTSGNFDFVISVMIRDIKQLITIQEEIASTPGVTNMKIAVAKMFNVWPLPREIISTF